MSQSNAGDGSDEFPYQPRLEITKTYDGSGQPASRAQTTRENIYDDFDENHPLIQVYELTQTSYYLRSTALGGAQIMDLSNTCSQVDAFLRRKNCSSWNLSLWNLSQEFCEKVNNVLDTSRMIRIISHSLGNLKY